RQVGEQAASSRGSEPAFASHRCRDRAARCNRAPKPGRLQPLVAIPERFQHRDRARDRALANCLVLDDHDRQGPELGRARRSAGDRRERPRRQDLRSRKRRFASHVAHRSHERRLGAGRAERGGGSGEAACWRPIGSDPRFRREGPAGATGRDGDNRRLAVLQARVSVSARNPDRESEQGRHQGARALPAGAPASVRGPSRYRRGPGFDAGKRRRPAGAGGAVILTPGTVLRLAALVLTGVVLQLSAVSEVTILGSNADLTPLIPLSVGLLAGSIPGAVVGFFTGLVFDMALVQTLGVTSLLLTGLGYLAGRYRELRDTSNAL